MTNSANLTCGNCGQPIQDRLSAQACSVCGTMIHHACKRAGDRDRHECLACGTRLPDPAALATAARATKRSLCEADNAPHRLTWNLDLDELARAQRFLLWVLLWSILAALLLAFLSDGQEMLSEKLRTFFTWCLIGVRYVVLLSLQIYSVYRLGRALNRSVWETLAYVAAMCIPIRLVPLIVLLVLNRQATIKLQLAGVPVGLLGARLRHGRIGR